MALTTGRRLGPYEIQAPLGAGGMGEVYKATDTRLDRTVAIKVLPEHVATDSELRQRFEREAKTLAALSHPHICPVYDVGSQDGIDFLVMEHLEGETLAQRLTKGALPLDQALRIAIQIADALDKAHRKGIVHRDLKPGNIMLTKSGAKLLDFGLAKLRPASVAGGVGLSEAPTVSRPFGAAQGEPLTGAGSILGTFQYMAPEQLEGQEADARTDIFAFGAVVYEMVTGKRAFEGKSQASLVAAILERDPAPISTVQPLSPPALERVVQKCLTKDAENRWHSTHDLHDELKWIADGMSQVGTIGSAVATRQSSGWRNVLVPTASLIIGGATAGGAVWFTTRPTPPSVVRTEITTAGAAALNLGGSEVALTPDGSRIVYRGQSQLFVRALDQVTPAPLTGSGAARGPFVSPDGQWVGYFETANLLSKVAITGGPPVAVANVDGVFGSGATWAEDGTIIFATNSPSTGLQRVPASGGQPTVLTKPDLESGEADHVLPEFLPGGQAVLFTITPLAGGLESAQVAVLNLRTNRHTVLVRGGYHAHYVPSGHLVYGTAGTLRAVAFDLERLATVGTSAAMIPQVLTTASGAVHAAVAANGTLVYTAGAAGQASRSLVWVDRTGREELLPAPSHAYLYPRLSPDNTRIALSIRSDEEDVWVWDLVRSTLTRLTFDSARDQRPVWTPDGRSLLFDSERGGESNIYMQAADGTGASIRLSENPLAQIATSITTDGTQAVLHENVPGQGQDSRLLTLSPLLVGGPSGVRTTPRDLLPAPSTGGEGRSIVGEVRTLIGTRFDERGAMLSPDNRWLAYESDSSGRFEIYVRPFPNVGDGQWQVSTGGGVQPLWARDGRELFYLAGDGSLMRVPVQPVGQAWSAGPPTKLFAGGYYDGGRIRQSRHYDVTADGKRFLMIKDSGSTEAAPAPQTLTVVQNWHEELKRLVPTN